MSRRSARIAAGTSTPHASSIAAQALIWYAIGQIPQMRAVMSTGSR